jgi:protein-L-isoaspartate O-methyltransferase
VGTERSLERMSRPPCDDRGAAFANPRLDESAAWTNRRATEQATRAAHARQVSGRRRFVDPTTSERAYTEAELEFMLAMNEYKRSSGRMFPTWSEVLEVLQGLGYQKVMLEELKEIERVHAGLSG